jgi:vacuolar-type H+-ATPase subunit E/Vma4
VALAVGGFVAGGWLGWEWRDRSCDAAAQQVRAEAAEVARDKALGALLQMERERDRERAALKADAARAAQDAADIEALTHQIEEMTDVVEDGLGQCLGAADVDRLRQLWGPGEAGPDRPADQPAAAPR